MRGERSDVRYRNVFEWVVRRLRRPGRGLLFVELLVAELRLRSQCLAEGVRSLRRHRRALLQQSNAMRHRVLQGLFDVRRRRHELWDGPGVLREQSMQLLRRRRHRRVPGSNDLCQWRLPRCSHEAMRRAG